MDDVVDLAAGRLGSPSDQAEQPLVRVRLAEQEDRFVGEDLAGEIAAVLLGQVVAKAREDDAVQAPILRRLKQPCTPTDELFMRPSLLSGTPRAKRASSAWEETLDAIIVAFGIAALLWPVLFEPRLARGGLSSILVPLAAVALLMVALRLALTLTWGRRWQGFGRGLVLISLGVAGVIGGFVLDATVGPGDVDWPVFAVGETLLAAVVIARLALLFRALDDMYAQAQASDRRFRSVFESAGVGISLGENGMMTETNEAFQRFLGYTGEELSQMHFLEVSHLDDHDLELDVDRELRAGERPSFTVERRYVRSDGQAVWARATITRSRDGSFGIAVIEDITERHELEERLRQSQRMEAVGQLAGGVAHDFNNLLTAINGYAELALPETGDRPALRRSVEAIKNAADRAASLTQQLLAFSRRQRLQPKVVDLNDVVAGSLGLVERLIREDVSVETSLASGLPPVKADPDQLTHVLLNLAMNARDAMPSGGTLRISSEVVDLDETAAQRLWEAPPGRYVRLSVADTGAGMEPAVLERVFEPFFTTKEVGAGTGLGLSTVYGVVKQSGGYVTVESEPGRGSRFDVYLPASGEPVAVAERPVEPPQTTGAARILVVEDEEIVCRLIDEALTAAGYDVTATSDPRSALELAREHPFDVLVTDVTMPHMSGPELARALLKWRPDLQVLYTSGYGAADQTDLIGEGAAFLPKPFALFELQSRVASLLEQRAA